MGVKIIAGKFRSTVLEVPDSARPTLTKNRQSLFDMIESLDAKAPEFFPHHNEFGKFFENLVVLDCFAGSGALGIEALSRGAAHVYFIDNDRRATMTIRNNISKIKAADFATILCTSVEKLKKFEKFRPARVDVAFLDPPYEKFSPRKVMENLYDINWIGKNTLLVFESRAQKSTSVVPENFQILKSKKIGISEFIILRPGLDRI